MQTSNFTTRLAWLVKAQGKMSYLMAGIPVLLEAAG
jgi:hypothetical protein